MSESFRTVTADQPLRRSMLDGWHRQQGAEFVALGDSLITAHYGSLPEERKQAVELALCDLSALPRAGVTGSGATDWLGAQGFAVPTHPNRADRQAGGDVLVRLSDHEHLLLGTRILRKGGARTDFPFWRDLPAWRLYALPRQDSHCCFAVTGAFAPELMSKVSAIDLRLPRFAVGQVAQTTLLHLSAIVLRHDLLGCPGYLLLVASTAAQFAFEAILEEMAEFNGTPVGLRALQSEELEP